MGASATAPSTSMVCPEGVSTVDSAVLIVTSMGAGPGSSSDGAFSSAAPTGEVGRCLWQGRHVKSWAVADLAAPGKLKAAHTNDPAGRQKLQRSPTQGKGASPERDHGPTKGAARQDKGPEDPAGHSASSDPIVKCPHPWVRKPQGRTGT